MTIRGGLPPHLITPKMNARLYNLSRAEKVSFHLDILVKLGCDYIAIYGTSGNYHKAYANETDESMNMILERDEQELAKHDIDIDDIARLNNRI